MNEKYIPLYRKYRPQKLEEIVGQSHIKKALTNAISMGRISHAYLFTGPRGTGKTSTARIFAKSLNCKDGPTITPCGVCENCKDITNSVPMDVIEIDAASNRKVEDAQNILEKVMYAPVNSRYKIYIIDEVHMLSNTAFNALLKTLEEPPKNVVFILATTEVHKVLDTIKSRCQRFDFKRITTDDIVKHLRYISDKENINITDEALFTIAKNSAGGMRDSIALLDQLSILDGENAISTDDINNLLGRISFDTLHALAQNIIDSNPQGAIEVLENIYNSGNEPSQILENLLGYFKNLLIVKNCKPEIIFELTQLNEAQIKELQCISKDLETHQITFLIEKTSAYVKEIKMATNARLWLEVGVIDLANLTENTKLIELQDRLTRLEGGAVPTSVPTYSAKAPERSVADIQNQIKTKLNAATQTKNEPVAPTTSPSVAKPTPEPPKPSAKPEPAKVSAKEVEEFSPMPKSKPVEGSDVATLWGMMLANISSVPTRALLKQWANPIKVSAEETIFTMKNEILMQQFMSGNKKQVITDALDTLFGQANSKFTVRLPQAGDEVVKPAETSVPQAKPISSAPPQTKSEPSVSFKPSQPAMEEEVDPTIEENLMAARADVGALEGEKEVQPPKKPSELSIGHSDQVNMVMDLFDGKIIE